MATDTRANYAVASAENGNYEHAKSVVIDLITEDYNNAQAHRAWGRVLLHEKKAADAVAAYRVAVGLESNDSAMWFEFAEALVAERRSFAIVPLPNMIEAKEAVATGLRLAPGDTRGHELRDEINRNLKAAAS